MENSLMSALKEDTTEQSKPLERQRQSGWCRKDYCFVKRHRMILKYLFRKYWGSFEILGELFFSPQGTDLKNIC